MKSHEKIMEQYEDALVAVMMEKIMVDEGNELLKENERLKADPNFVIPEDADRSCHKFIQRAFGKRKRVYAARTAWRVFQRVSVAVFIGILLFTGVYAVLPDVRTATRNLLIEMSDVSTSISFRPEGGASESAQRTSKRIYKLGELPDGFELTEKGDDGHSYWTIYLRNNASILLDVRYDSNNAIMYFDTEDADSIESIEIHGDIGLLVEKGNVIRAVLADEENQIFIEIACNGLSREDALNVVWGLTYTEYSQINMESSVDEGDLLPYEIEKLPDGFVLTGSGNSGHTYWKYYENEIGDYINLELYDGSDGGVHCFDTEDTDSIEPIEIGQKSGILVEKDSWICATIADQEHQIFVDIICNGLSREEALNVISSLIYTGQDF